MTLTANTRAALLMAAAMAGFTISDTLVKTVSSEMSIGQVMMIRGIIMIGLLGAYIRASRTSISLQVFRSKPLLLRVVSEVIATIFFLTALFGMPIANVSAILQALPLAVTLGAAIFLGERVGIRRLSAILAGFVGVMIIIRPGTDGFNSFALLVVVTVIFAAMRDLSTRQIDKAIPSIAVTLLTTIAVTAVGTIMVLAGSGWQPVAPPVYGILTAAAFGLFAGYQCIILAMRNGDIHIVAPFRYTGLLWAIVLGAVVFGELPDTLTVFGAAIVVASGLYTLYRERIVTTSGKPAGSSASSPPPARGT